MGYKIKGRVRICKPDQYMLISMRDHIPFKDVLEDSVLRGFITESEQASWLKSSGRIRRRVIKNELLNRSESEFPLRKSAEGIIKITKHITKLAENIEDKTTVAQAREMVNALRDCAKGFGEHVDLFERITKEGDEEDEFNDGEIKIGE